MQMSSNEMNFSLPDDRRFTWFSSIGQTDDVFPIFFILSQTQFLNEKSGTRNLEVIQTYLCISWLRNLVPVRKRKLHCLKCWQGFCPEKIEEKLKWKRKKENRFVRPARTRLCTRPSRESINVIDVRIGWTIARCVALWTRRLRLFGTWRSNRDDGWTRIRWVITCWKNTFLPISWYTRCTGDIR